MKPLLILFSIAASAYAADPAAVITGISRDDASGGVTVSYVLSGADAIVTFGGDASPSAGVWNRLADSAFRQVQGDVNRLVAVDAGTVRTITWTPDPRDSEACCNGFRARLTLWSPSAPPDFLSVEIGGGKELRYYVSEAALPCQINDKYWKMDRILFRKIPAKGVVWNMASVSATRYVRLMHDYYLAVYPYTKAQAQAVASLDTSRQDVVADGADFALCPQFRASYSDWRGDDPDGESAAYALAANCDFATVRARIDLAVDFPTEAEWEYAARAGCGGALYTGESPTSENVQKVAWFADDGGKLNEVGLKLSNRWGLHDMLGNVNEWCLDYYAPAGNGYFSSGTLENPEDDPAGPSSAQVRRGGTITRVVRGDYYASGLSDVSKGLNHRDGQIYKGIDSPSLGVRFCAPIPGASAAEIENGTSRWPSLDTTVVNSYWNCTGYENPAVIDVEQEITGVDLRRCVSSASSEVAPDGMLDSFARFEGISNLSRLNSFPAMGVSIIIR